MLSQKDPISVVLFTGVTATITPALTITLVEIFWQNFIFKMTLVMAWNDEKNPILPRIVTSTPTFLNVTWKSWKWFTIKKLWKIFKGVYFTLSNSNSIDLLRIFGAWYWGANYPSTALETKTHLHSWTNRGSLTKHKDWFINKTWETQDTLQLLREA